MILGNGWTNFTKGNWNASNFVVAYINLPLFFGAVFIHWFLHGRKPFTPPSEIDLHSNIPSDEEVTYEDPKPKNWFLKIVRFLFT